MLKRTKPLVAFVIGVFAAAVALADDTAAPAAAPRARLWSCQPLRAQDIPVVHDKKWVRTPVDSFVLARLESKGLAPSTNADRAAFARRVTLDTLGYIPAPEAVKAFLEDRSADAYEKLVDGLLASPYHDERLARHWLDRARYSDSAGFQNDQTRANAWRYRDYVINAFNSDKSYDQFIKEQLAGDEIPGATKEIRVYGEVVKELIA